MLVLLVGVLRNESTFVSNLLEFRECYHLTKYIHLQWQVLPYRLWLNTFIYNDKCYHTDFIQLLVWRHGFSLNIDLSNCSSVVLQIRLQTIPTAVWTWSLATVTACTCLEICIHVVRTRTHTSACPPTGMLCKYTGLARTVYLHHIWPYVWSFPLLKIPYVHRIYL